MSCKVIPVLIILSCLLTGSALAQFDQGVPDTLALEVTIPPTGATNGQLTAELWGFNDANNLLGISIGLQWANNNLHLDSVISEQANWDMTFLEYSNDDYNMLFAGLSISVSNILPAGDTRKKLATWYFTMATWNEGDLVAFDTSEYFGGAAMIMSDDHGESYTPVWAGGNSWMVFEAPAIPRSWYISPDGNDSNDGTLARPFATFIKAFVESSDMDTVMVMPGTYTGDFARGMILSSKALTIMSTDGPEVTIIDAEGASRIFRISNISSPGITIEGLTFRNGNSTAPDPGYSSVGGAIVISNTTGTLNNCVFENNTATSGNAIYVSVMDNGPLRLTNCQFYNNFGPGSSALFHVWGNQSVFSMDNCTFVDNRCDTGAVILSTGHSSDGAQFDINNSIFAFNQGSALFNTYGTDLNLGCTDIFGNGGGDWTGELSDLQNINNNLSVDPEFCDRDANDFHLYAFSPCAPDNSPCGELIGALGVNCAGPGEDDVVYPTNEWISIYCPGGVIVEGQLLGSERYIMAYDPDGVLCGIGQTNAVGQLPLFAIYRDDIYTERDEGAEPGDMITFVIGGRQARAVPDLYWTTNGAVTPVCQFELEKCVGIKLNQGWNLISWNVWYEADITEALADVMECVDVVLGFEQGGLTFDPDLPQFSSLSQVDAYHGYWVRMNCAATLTICGEPIGGGLLDTVYSIPVETGWNLLSFWPDRPVPTETAFAHALQMEVLEVAIGFDHGAQVWLPGQTNFNTLTELKPGFGYWAKMSQGFDFGWRAADLGDSVPADFFDDGISLANQPKSASGTQLKVANSWVSVYGDDIKLNGEKLREGALVTFHTADGELRGEGHYQNGRLAFTPVYGPDIVDNPMVLAPHEPEQLVIRVDGTVLREKLDWTTNGDRIRLERLTLAGDGSLPTEYRLSQNYPNPFNPSTTILFGLPENSHVKLTIFNVLGQNVATLVDLDLPAGEHQVVWDAGGESIASGVYFYRMETTAYTMTKKMLLTK